MADGTKIEWTDATWNIVNGCSVVSPGCTNCYAMRLAGTRLKHHPSREGLTIDTKAGPVWTGETRFNDKVLLDPIRWKGPRRIFVCAHGDLFHDSVPDEWIDRVFAVMAVCRHHTFQVLTKRPERARAYLTHPSRAHLIDVAVHRDLPDYTLVVWQWPLQNVWLGVSVEDQARADERVPILLDIPAAVRWLSCEPLLGPINLTNIDASFHAAVSGMYFVNTLTGEHDDMCRPCKPVAKIDWVVGGGESGPGARPMHPDWVRSLRDQCAKAGTPFLFKQWGEWADADSWMLNGGLDDCFHEGTRTVRVGKKRAGRQLDGVQHDGYPA